VLLIGLAINKLLRLCLALKVTGSTAYKRSTAVISFVMLSGMGLHFPLLFRHIAAKEYSKAKAQCWFQY
jgi:hypothetical protein